jgi:hypothetical protein
MGHNLCMEWCFLMEWKRREVLIHVQHLLDKLLAFKLLLLGLHLYPILKLELSEEASLPYCQLQLLDIWPKNDHIHDLSDNPTKIRDCYIEQLKCFNFKLQEQERIKKKIFEKEIIIQKLTTRSRFLLLKGCFV